MKITKFGLIAISTIVAFTGTAKADYNVWTDAKTRATLTFPDTWKQVNNELPIDLITLSLPSGDDAATCRVRVEEDRRFMIYPNRYRKDIRDQFFTTNFWAKTLTAYNNVNLIKYEDNAGLGQGFASMALVSYLTPPNKADGSDVTDRGGIMAVTSYGDKVYLAECSSYLPSYSKYHVQFMDFFKSITFKKAYHELAVGDYRNFLNDWGTVNVPFPNAVSRSTY